MANKQTKKSEQTQQALKKSGTGPAIFATLGVLAVGAVAAGAAVLTRARQSGENEVVTDTHIDETEGSGEQGAAEHQGIAVATMPASEPMRYTGTGTPDMAINYTPGIDGSSGRVAGDNDTASGAAEGCEALAGVRD